MNDVLKQISVNLGVTGYDDSSILIGIADYYGVNTAISNSLMGDILDAVGGNAATSNNYIQDIVIALGGPSTSNNWIEEWETITAVPPAPVNTIAPVISGTMVVGQTLTTTNGTWTNSPTSFTYKWYKGITAIVGATSSTYILVQADAGTTTAIKCEVTAINLGGSTAADSNTLTTVYDADAQAFITAAVITVLVQMTAINELTIGLKADSLWTSMKAIYPFVGGTASTHKFNLKNPLNTDAAFRLVFNGGWTHSSTGATANGTNGYANTFLAPSSVLTLNNTHLSFYSRTQNTTLNGLDISSVSNSFQRFFGLTAYYNSLATGLSVQYLHPANSAIGYSGSTQGLFVGSRLNSTINKLYRNTSILGTNVTTNFSILPTSNVTISANGNTGNISEYQNRQCAFASIGDGLSDANVSSFYTRVQAFQTTLGRNV
jgi:hypothetical protein